MRLMTVNHILRAGNQIISQLFQNNGQMLFFAFSMKDNDK